MTAVPRPLHPVPPKRVKSLQELVQARLDVLDLSPRRAAERSNGLVSYETIRQLQNGKHRGRMTARVAEGLALALSIPVSRVYEAAEVTAPEAPWELPEECHRLPARYRAGVEDHIRELLRALEDEL